MTERVFEAPVVFLASGVEAEGLSTELESLKDVDHNANLYIFNQDVA